MEELLDVIGSSGEVLRGSLAVPLRLLVWRSGPLAVGVRVRLRHGLLDRGLKVPVSLGRG